MPSAKSDTTPYWSTSATFPQYPKLGGDIQADVVVVGGGITGLTAAYLLAKAGKRVIVLERGRCAATDTGHTSAHLTMVTDERLGDLANGFGRTHAQAVWDAGFAAIATIDDIVREHRIDAGFEWVDGYLHAPSGEDPGEHAEHLKADAQLAGELGFDAEYLDLVPLVGRPGVRFANQARIHPRQYLAGVAKAFVALGGRIVPFHMTNVGPRATPTVPWISAFSELNVRTYVRVADRTGVYFFSLDAARRLAVAAGARAPQFALLRRRHEARATG